MEIYLATLIGFGDITRKILSFGTNNTDLQESKFVLIPKNF